MESGTAKWKICKCIQIAAGYTPGSLKMARAGTIVIHFPVSLSLADECNYLPGDKHLKNIVGIRHMSGNPNVLQ
jgi:hypothetical protein